MEQLDTVRITSLEHAKEGKKMLKEGKIKSPELQGKVRVKCTNTSFYYTEEYFDDNKDELLEKIEYVYGCRIIEIKRPSGEIIKLEP